MKYLLLALLITGCGTFQTAVPDATPIPGPGQCEGDACEPIQTPRVQDSPVATESQDLKFESHGNTLLGEVIKPKDLPGPYPVVVIVHDLGPFNRDGLVHENFGVILPAEVPVYRAMAEELAAAGFAVVTYDKRTCVQGGRVFCTYPRTYLEPTRSDLASVLADDAQAAIAAVQADRSLSNGFVAVLGHGAGSDVALELSRRGLKLNAIVALSWSLASPSEQVLHQLRTSKAAIEGRIAEENTAETDELKGQLTQVNDALKAAETALSTGGAFGGVEGAVWTSLDRMHRAAVEHARVGTTPLLVMVGSADFNSPDDDEDDLKAALAGKATWESLDGVTHDLVDVTGDATTLSPDVTKAIVEFLRTP
ncbi:MAG: alpha/beta hydrolase [bacterium]